MSAPLPASPTLPPTVPPGKVGEAGSGVWGWWGSPAGAEITEARDPSPDASEETLSKIAAVLALGGGSEGAPKPQNLNPNH